MRSRTAAGRKDRRDQEDRLRTRMRKSIVMVLVASRITRVRKNQK